MGTTEQLGERNCPYCGADALERSPIGTWCSNCERLVEEADLDTVRDYYQFRNGDRVLASSYSIAKPQKDNGLFDPRTPEAREAFFKYRKKFKNRRRYQRDRERRNA